MNIMCYCYDQMADFEVTLLLTRLRQVGCAVQTVGDCAGWVMGQSGLCYRVDVTVEQAEQEAMPDAIVLPGGPINPTQYAICPLLCRMEQEHRLIAAICFAPQFLARAGLLERHDYTTSCSASKMAQLGYEDFFPRQRMRMQRVVEDGAVITAQGYAFVDFAEAVCRYLHVADEQQLRTWFAPVKETETALTVHDYQRQAMRTLNPMLSRHDVLINGVMGLCGESGEAIDVVKKHLAQGHPLDRDALVKELGDVAWYLAETAEALGVPLEDVLQQNLDKLKKRYPAGFSSERSRFRGSSDEEKG